MIHITIVDYGSGNVLSAQKSFIKVTKDNNIDAKVLISNDLDDIKKSTHIVLPGQGSFSTCMNGLKNTPGLIEELHDFAIVKKKPFLGICLGAQMLANNLGGTVQRAKDKSFEIGFYNINPVKAGLKLFQGQKTFFQWHKEGFSTPLSCQLLATGDTFQEQAFQYKNAYGIQFHPEVNSKMHLKWLYYAGYMLREKGAQKKMQQLNLRLKHGKKINMWLDYFLDNYLLKKDL